MIYTVDNYRDSCAYLDITEVLEDAQRKINEIFTEDILKLRHQREYGRDYRNVIPLVLFDQRRFNSFDCIIHFGFLDKFYHGMQFSSDDFCKTFYELERIILKQIKALPSVDALGRIEKLQEFTEDQRVSFEPTVDIRFVNAAYFEIDLIKRALSFYVDEHNTAKSLRSF